MTHEKVANVKRRFCSIIGGAIIAGLVTLCFASPVLAYDISDFTTVDGGACAYDGGLYCGSSNCWCKINTDINSSTFDVSEVMDQTLSSDFVGVQYSGSWAQSYGCIYTTGNLQAGDPSVGWYEADSISVASPYTVRAVYDGSVLSCYYNGDLIVTHTFGATKDFSYPLIHLDTNSNKILSLTGTGGEPTPTLTPTPTGSPTPTPVPGQPTNEWYFDREGVMPSADFDIGFSYSEPSGGFYFLEKYNGYTHVVDSYTTAQINRSDLTPISISEGNPIIVNWTGFISPYRDENFFIVLTSTTTGDTLRCEFYPHYEGTTYPQIGTRNNYACEFTFDGEETYNINVARYQNGILIDSEQRGAINQIYDRENQNFDKISITQSVPTTPTQDYSYFRYINLQGSIEDSNFIDSVSCPTPTAWDIGSYLEFYWCLIKSWFEKAMNSLFVPSYSDLSLIRTNALILEGNMETKAPLAYFYNPIRYINEFDISTNPHTATFNIPIGLPPISTTIPVDLQPEEAIQSFIDTNLKPIMRFIVHGFFALLWYRVAVGFFGLNKLYLDRT
jgi:hypothetical protein